MDWYPDKNREFKRQARLYDRAIVTVDGSTHEGLVTFISERGINIATGYGEYFFKWCHVQKTN